MDSGHQNICQILSTVLSSEFERLRRRTSFKYSLLSISGSRRSSQRRGAESPLTAGRKTEAASGNPFWDKNYDDDDDDDEEEEIETVLERLVNQRSCNPCVQLQRVAMVFIRQTGVGGKLGGREEVS